MTYASIDDHSEFVDRCFRKLDVQIFALESEAAKASAIQTVQRVLRDYLLQEGEAKVLDLIRYPRRVEEFR